MRARLAAVLSVLGACGIERDPPADLPRYVATLDADRVTLVRDDETLTTLRGDLLEVGAVDDPSIIDDWNFDPWWLDSDDPLAVRAEVPPGLRFGRPADLGLAVAITLDAIPSRGRADRFRIHLAPDPTSAPRIAYLRVALDLDPADRFYGGGGLHKDIELRGQRLAMQLEADFSRESVYNERHVPVPLVLSTRGWAFFAATDHAMVFDVAHSDPDRLVVTIGIAPDAAAGVDLWLFAADHPLDLLHPYYETTGFPRVPPEWGHGPWFWRDEIAGQAAVLDDLATIRALSLPASAYWIDRPYASALQTFDFAPDDYPDPNGMLAEARAAGFRMALWHTPYATRDATEVFAAIMAGGFFPPEQGLQLNNFGSPPVDLTNGEAVGFWQDQLAAYRNPTASVPGIEGYKLDFAEDVVLGLPGKRMNRWRFDDGRDERTMQHAYAALYHATYRHTLADADQGGFILARAGRWGGQALVDAIWPGDLDADFAVAGGGDGVAGAGDEVNRRVGGIPAALAYHLSLSASGYPFFAADTGGYRNGPPDSEMYRRWFELTAVSVVMQIGGGDNQVPWEAERFGWDDALLDDFRRYAQLHLRLFPYARHLVEQIAVTGRSPVRPFGLQHPELGVDPDDVYFFGDDMLVAPVVSAWARTREVPFPPGRWVDWWSATAHDVPAFETKIVGARLGEMPLFLREGAIIPLLDASQQTLAPADGSAVRGHLVVRIVPPRDGSSLELSDGTRIAVTRVATGEMEGDVQISYTPGTRWGPAITWEVLRNGTFQRSETDGPASFVIGP